ncbi:hypothetical protein FDV58_27905 [Bradyrhizobium elkanii]|uniref:Uncharacterized protein n=1 Tax=Bradyrhizobium elkanii TaxID=29448 RepID=A0A4U6RSY8_BRAEL|nr:hypothetical protein [Bradyrhizobium sp. BR2003]TKV78024.1 hypothetical protein FDV58_27905 [Bradyrhizobium elkanii]
MSRISQARSGLARLARALGLLGVIRIASAAHRGISRTKPPSCRVQAQMPTAVPLTETATRPPLKTCLGEDLPRRVPTVRRWRCIATPAPTALIPGRLVWDGARSDHDVLHGVGLACSRIGALSLQSSRAHTRRISAVDATSIWMLKRSAYSRSSASWL